MHNVNHWTLGKDRKGFTLIEILVAISILGISLVVILQLFSGGLRSARLSDEYTRAIFHGREKMEEMLVSEQLQEGNLEGEFEDHFRWKVEVVRVEPVEEEEARLPFDTFLIQVHVLWREGEEDKQFQIRTMKVAEKLEDEERS